MISIWFFIGVSLAVNGVLIFGSRNLPGGESSSGSGRGAVQPARQCVVGRRASVVIGLIYCVQVLLPGGRSKRKVFIRAKYGERKK